MVELEEPDKGRAWLVAIAACMINMILSGLSRMIGMLYVEVIVTYGTSRAEATLPFTVRNSIRMLSGPLVGIIGQRFGIRTVTFVGGVIASTGAALCFFAPGITALAIFWGGIHGFGFAMANTLFQVVVNQYFLKYRATASGIALSGACVGSMAFPYMIEAILDNYGLQGAFLIIAGVVVHVLPPSLLLCSPQWIEYPKAYAKLWALKHSENTVENVDSPSVENFPAKDLLEVMASGKLERANSMSDCPIDCRDICKSKSGSASSDHKYTFRADNCQVSNCRPVVCTVYRIKECTEEIKKLSFQNGNTFPPTLKNELNTISAQVQSETLKSLGKTKERNQNTQTVYQSIKSIIKLYTNPVYILISICMSTYIVIFVPILTVIVDYGSDKGLPESAGKYLINAMSFGDLAGRLCFGWVTDKKFMTIPCFLATILALQGAFIALFPFANTLYTLMILVALYALMAGSILVLFPVLVLQYVDIKSQAVAMSCVGFLSGLVSLAIPSMIGHFRDNVGSYDGMFYLTGVISVVSGGMWLLEPVVAKRYFANGGENAAKDAYCPTVIQNNLRIPPKNSNLERPS